MSEVRVKAKVRPRPRDGERIRVRDRFRVRAGLVLLPTQMNVRIGSTCVISNSPLSGSLWEWLT